MGALCQFDEMLPTISQEAGNRENSYRQVEVFTHGGSLYLRIGRVDEENSGVGRYTVELSKQAAKQLISGIQRGIDYLNLPD